MKDSERKVAWENQNVIKVTCKINKNQNPELYDILSRSETRGSLVRELMQEAIEARKAKLDEMLRP